MKHVPSTTQVKFAEIVPKIVQRLSFPLHIFRISTAEMLEEIGVTENSLNTLSCENERIVLDLVVDEIYRLLSMDDVASLLINHMSAFIVFLAFFVRAIRCEDFCQSRAKLVGDFTGIDRVKCLKNQAHRDKTVQ